MPGSKILIGINKTLAVFLLFHYNMLYILFFYDTIILTVRDGVDYHSEVVGNSDYGNVNV